MKILNLYACLGGNRYKWDEVTNIEVTAVEWDEELARLYKERFPNDKVIVADVLCKFHDYDFHKYKGKQRKDKIARNLVDYAAGKTILEIVLGIVKEKNTNQTKLF